MPTLTRQVTNPLGSGECIYVPSTATFGLSSPYWIAGGDNWPPFFNVDFGGAARFINITIPPGSVITLAQLKLISGETNAVGVVNSRLRAQKHINPIAFSTIPDFVARTWTNAKANWDAIPGWVLNTEYTSPDIKACIQEVIGLPGWASGNPIVIEWDDWEMRSDVGHRTNRVGFFYVGAVAKAPVLYIEYTPTATTVGNHGYNLSRRNV